MNLNIDCNYTWINQTTEKVSCNTDLAHDYLILQLALGIGLSVVALYLVLKSIEWIDQNVEF